MKGKTDFRILIRRFNPETDKKPYYKEYNLKIAPGTTVLDTLHEIKNTIDSTLSMRFSCRMGVCGSCAMLINGKPGLACNTQVLDVSSKALNVSALPNFDTIKDLVPDLSPMFNKHVSIEPYIKNKSQTEVYKPTGEFYQSPEELVNYLQFTYCIKCGACMAACPTLATDREYLGPMPLTQAHRYNADTRDNGFSERKKTVGGKKGAFRCHYAGECSNVCPKGVDPARAIQIMKRNLVLDYIKLLRKKKPCEVLGKPTDSVKKPDIPEAPKYTV